MAGTMTNIENNTIRMYWNALRSMNKNIRLGLAVKLIFNISLWSFHWRIGQI